MFVLSRSGSFKLPVLWFSNVHALNLVVYHIKIITVLKKMNQFAKYGIFLVTLQYSLVNKGKSYGAIQCMLCLFEIHKLAVCFPLAFVARSLQGH